MHESIKATELPHYIDQTNLDPYATGQDMEGFVKEAVAWQFYAVCVLPNWVPLAKKITNRSFTKVATVVSFPFGSDVSADKASSAKRLRQLGADEIDMVVNVAAALAGDYETVEAEVARVRQRLGGNGVLKVIIETPKLTAAQIKETALAAERGGVDIVKTSTGFKGLGLRATTVADVVQLRQVLLPSTGIKASGGIRTWEMAQQMIAAGATRIGTSNGVGIMQEALRLEQGD